ncbi:YHS domain-containing (seleno)protein [Motiliproteus sp. SC1-56]|uniref:YHS domain-containing (seleno)protein n=1 Tax=Motiliproteus sp. SC1-56 TaxID=2799565 RepID=UPI001F5D1ED1|nr:YHS domain-containing (seleno)protein [Motiliproteus sp. SC1-56]
MKSRSTETKVLTRAGTGRQRIGMMLAGWLVLIAPLAAAEPVSTGWLGSRAIGGHDSVAYFEARSRGDHRALVGEERFKVDWNGADWWFASAASAERFAADPERYRPAYNGFCSNALTLGEGLIDTDGRVWEIFGDRLHLFYAERGRQRWLNGDWRALQRQADAVWESLR